MQGHEETSLIIVGEKQMIRKSCHTVCHFPDFSKDWDARSDGIFLAELGATAWQSRQGKKQGEPEGWRKISGRAPQINGLGINIT